MVGYIFPSVPGSGSFPIFWENSENPSFSEIWVLRACQPAKTVKVGDYVQWTSGGADQFRVARKVVGIFPDGNHAQVFGSNTGIPMSELRVVDPPEAAATPPVVIAVPASSEAVVQGENDFTVLQRGNRLQITADVDLEGVATLKEMLTDYESILRRLAGKKTQQQEPAAKDFSVTVYAPDGVREVRTEFFADLPELLEFIEQHKAGAPHSLLHARLPARVSPNQRHAVSLAGAEVI